MYSITAWGNAGELDKLVWYGVSLSPYIIDEPL